MEQWSILSNVVKYVQYNRNPRDCSKLDIKMLEEKDHRKMYDSLKGDYRQIIELDFGNTPEKLKEKYLDMYDGVKSEVSHTMKFDENSYLCTTYLGRIDMTRLDKIKVEERYSISEQGYTVGKLLDGIECQILLDIGASKSFISKMYYLRCKLLLSLLKFASKTQRIQVGNGQYISVLFVIPTVLDIHGHRFQIFTLVSEIHDNVDIVL